MTEDVNIKLTTELDASGLNALRQGLNEQRNELNAVARETDKTNQAYKNLKATTAELNRLIKLSDQDLKKYAGSLIQTETAVTKVSTAKGKLMTNTEKLTKSFSNLKTNVGSYSTTLVNLTSDIASGDKSIMQSIGTLGLYAGGWAAVASGIYLAVQNLVDWNNENSKVIQNRQLNTPQTNVDRGFGKYNQTRPPGVGMFDVNIGPQWDQSNVQYAPTWESLTGPQQAEILQNRNQRQSSTRSGADPLKKAVEKIESAKAVVIQGGTAYFFKDIPPMGVNEAKGIDLSGLDLFGGQPMHIETNAERIARESAQTLVDTQAVFSGVSSIIGVLNLGTDTFVSKMLGGFNSVLTVMEAIKTVNSILNFIPGFASGGVASGLFMAGEKGAELIHVGDNQARVYNHTETMRMINSQSTNPNVNVYLSANISEKFIDAKIESYNRAKHFRRV